MSRRRSGPHAYKVKHSPKIPAYVLSLSHHQFFVRPPVHCHSTPIVNPNLLSNMKTANLACLLGAASLAMGLALPSVPSKDEQGLSNITQPLIERGQRQAIYDAYSGQARGGGGCTGGRLGSSSNSVEDTGKSPLPLRLTCTRLTYHKLLGLACLQARNVCF